MLGAPPPKSDCIRAALAALSCWVLWLARAPWRQDRGRSPSLAAAPPTCMT